MQSDAPTRHSYREATCAFTISMHFPVLFSDEFLFSLCKQARATCSTCIPVLDSVQGLLPAFSTMNTSHIPITSHLKHPSSQLVIAIAVTH